MMQDLRSMQATGGRMFGGGERRLRPFPNQALKCPRCESLNTKFCYYNNYNLSQPRHFCKNCRRYWTKGGVLRNVPIGGGCRKTKRSKPKPPSASSSDNKEKKSNNNIINNNNTTCHSSSESSSLTNTTPTTEAASSSAGLHNTTTTTNNNYQDSRSFFLNQTPESNFEPYTLDQQDGGVFPETGTFTSLMTVSNPSFLGYNFNEIYPFRLQHEQGQIQLQQQQQQHHHQNSMIEDEIKMHELTATAAAAAGCLDHRTVPIDLRGTGNGEAIDWQSNDQGLFDLPHTVDQGYWGQSQWTDNDQHLYLPP